LAAAFLDFLVVLASVGFLSLGGLLASLDFESALGLLASLGFFDFLLAFLLAPPSLPASFAGFSSEKKISCLTSPSSSAATSDEPMQNGTR
jgi:hypothetical protein